MSVHNDEVADLFKRLADLLEIEGADFFRVQAYRNAARVIGGMSQSVADMLRDGRKLTELPGVGKDLAEKIKTIVETGKLPLLEEVEQRVPAALSELMRIPGLGPKRVKALYEQLHVESLDDLQRAAEEGRISELPTFGKKTEDMIKARVGRRLGKEQRITLLEAESVARPLLDYLRKTPGLKQVEVAGSYRRRRETVGDLDILATAASGSRIMDRFVAYDEVEEVTSKGSTRSTVRLRSGLQVDLRVVPQVSYGAAPHYFTGSKAHNIAVRTIGVKRKLKINEYGVFRGEKRVAGRTEAEVYREVGLPYIEPELREDQGEVEAARENRLPKLLTLADIRGDLHCHTKASDGHDTMEAMIEAAREHGYEYLAITDHSKRVSVAHGLDEKRLAEQIREVDRLNARYSDIRILKSIEVDILEDGSLDLPDAILRDLDFRVCSVHYKFDLSGREQTDRIIRAMDNPYFNVLAHPTGRLLNERDPYEVDLERIMRAARERSCCLEVNANPYRLDLTGSAVRMAKDIGVKIVVSTDAHSTEGLQNMRFGVDQARRGWLEATDVVNTRSLAELPALFMRA